MTDLAHRNALLDFCPGCFATAEDSSGGGAPIPEGNYCTNCGNVGLLNIPRWAVESIRAQASFVGKRYYPIDEDRDQAAELAFLRARMPDHETDRWVIWRDEDRHDPVTYLFSKRRVRNAICSQMVRLPPDHTEEDVEAAKARLRRTMPISSAYLEAEGSE